MKTKNLMVFSLAIVSFLLLVASVSAGTTNLANVELVKVNGLEDALNEDISVMAGEVITVKVYFTADEDASDVRVKAELEGDKTDVYAVSSFFDVEDGKRYSKILTLKVPYELEDEESYDMALNLKIWNGDYKTEHDEITLRVQRESYNVEVASINMPQSVAAGETLPVTVVVRNNGYNDLDNLYATVKIDSLGIQRTSYFGDVVAVECNEDNEDGRDCEDDDEDTASAKFYLDIPYAAEAGAYEVTVEVKNSDLTLSRSAQVVVENDFAAGNVVATSTQKSAEVDEDVSYSLLVVNPTNKLKVYRVVAESSAHVASSTNAVVAVPAGASQSVTVTASADNEGEHAFDVSVLSGESLVGKVTLNLSAEGSSVSAATVLTVILAVIFLVLLAVLVVLLRKKPESAEEFGESYY